MQQDVVLGWQEWATLDATAMAELVRRSEVSPEELARQARAAAELVNPVLNAVLEVFGDIVENPYRDGMTPEGRFHGVPMLAVDMGSAMAGRLQERGCLFLKGVRRTEDDPLTRNWREAGFNLIGRTALPPMGHASVSDSLLHGVTHNPWHPDFAPGGVSGGSAAAVAARIVPIATGLDGGGGSIRGSAGATGLVGIKCTRGRVPRPAANNELADHIAIEGILTRSVRDAAAALDYMCRQRPGETFMPITPPAGAYAKRLERPVEGLRVAIIVGECGRETQVDQACVARVLEVGQVLDGLGHHVEEVDEETICDWSVLWRGADVNWIGGTRFWPVIAAEHGRELTKDNCEPLYRHLIQAGQAFTVHDFHRMRAENALYTRQFGEFFQSFDLMLTPVEASAPPMCGAESPQSPLCPVYTASEAVSFVEALNDAARFLVPANDVGYPAIAVPAGLDQRGVPLGAQLCAGWCREDLLLNVAAQLEQAIPEWFDAEPPESVSSRAANVRAQSR